MKSETCSQLRGLILILAVVGAIGCSGDSAETGSSASHEEITAFLQENPEFAKPDSESEEGELGLGQ